MEETKKPMMVLNSTVDLKGASRGLFHRVHG